MNSYTSEIGKKSVHCVEKTDLDTTLNSLKAKSYRIDDVQKIANTAMYKIHVTYMGIDLAD